jgi:predicted nucleic acid-binding protein
MKILLDTNIALDAIAERKPFSEAACKIINLILDNKLEGYLTANSIADIYYIARKHLANAVLRDTLRYLFRVFSIIDVLGKDCQKALDFQINDYEDALLVICGGKIAVDYIITRDEEFLRQAISVPVISPADFLLEINMI